LKNRGGGGTVREPPSMKDDRCTRALRVGKISFTPDKLIENATVLITSVIKAKPSVAKGKYIKGCYLSSTMGPGIPLYVGPIEAAAKA